MTFEDIFIFRVPQATAFFDKTGYVYINNCFIEETQLKNIHFFDDKQYLEQNITQPCHKVSGTVAIISHLYPKCYSLWFFDVLSQLALLEIHNIAYDYLIIPCDQPFMKDFLILWGLDPAKVISLRTGIHIQADTIIFPTSTSRTKQCISCSNYYIDFLLKYIRKKLLKNLNIEQTIQNMPEKIFISRNDAHGKRAIPNENEIFALFEPFGFKRYCLTNLSVSEKILLFHHAKCVVSFVGSGSCNIMFCQPSTQYIEITHKMIEATFFFLADMFDVNYHTINASTIADLATSNPWIASETFPISYVQKFLNDNQHWL